MKKSKSKVGFHKIAGATRVVIKNGKKDLTGISRYHLYLHHYCTYFCDNITYFFY